MKIWKNLFESHILARGRSYYQSGAVYKVTEVNGGYDACVEGTENYEIEIDLEDNVIDEMWCSCHYDEDGYYCKHIAAVLYHLEESVDEFVGKSSEGQTACKLQTVMDELTEKELRDLLLELASVDSEIKNRIITTFSKSDGEKELQQLKKEVDDIAYEYSDRYGLIGYRQADNYVRELQCFLDHYVQCLIDNGCYLQAFELVNHIFVSISQQELDYSNGGHGVIVTSCCDFWENILERCSKQDEAVMLEWFLKYQNGYVVDYMEEYLDDFLMAHFNDKNSIVRKMALLDEQIEAIEQNVDSNQSGPTSYKLTRNVLKRLELMKRLECSEKEIVDYRQKFAHLSAVRIGNQGLIGKI